MDKTKVIAVIGIAVATVGLYYLLSPVPVEPEPKQEPKRTQSPPKPQSKPPVAEPPKPQIRSAPLTLHEYVSCIQKINAALVQKLKTLKQEFNRSRRAHNNSEEYLKTVAEYKAKERSVWENTCNEIIAAEKLPMDLYDSAHNEFMNKIEVVAEKENLKKTLTFGTAPEGITEERVKEIMEFEIKLLADAHSVEDHIKNSETIAHIEDRIFDTYALEIEDLRAASNLFQDKLKPLTRQILRNYSRFKI